MGPEFRERDTPIDVKLWPRLAVTTTEAAVDAAILGIGIVRLLHYQMSEAVEAGKLNLVVEDAEPDPVPVHLVHATRGHMPLKLHCFIDFAAQRLRARLGRLPRGDGGEAAQKEPGTPAEPYGHFFSGRCNITGRRCVDTSDAAVTAGDEAIVGRVR